MKQQDYGLATTTVEKTGTDGRHMLSFLDKIYVERGTMDDWKLLEALHYKNASLGVGPRIMRCVIDDGVEPRETIGAMVYTTPKPLDAGRNVVFPHLKPNKDGRDNKLVNVMRMKWINKNIILGSRMVLDTMYRGAGVAYRFRNLAMRMMGFRYVEARAMMTRYNLYVLKSGAKFLPPGRASAFDEGLVFFSRHFESAPHDFSAIMRELEGMQEHVRERTLVEMRAFYYRHSSMEKSGDKRLNGMSRIEKLPTDYLLKQISQLVFGATLYSLFENPDHGRELPTRLPLTVFHNQGANEPLRLDLIP